MSKKNLSLYFFTEAGTVISTKRLRSLKGLLPTIVDIERRRLICESQDIPYEPFIVELSEAQGNKFCEEICGKCNCSLPSKYLFLHSSNPFSVDNPPVAKIVIKLEKE